ncbi:MAG: GLPGLI family protein [Mangrovimonas sp.]|nr:GLPGLI family protein [Mangrovimonas sp.]
MILRQVVFLFFLTTFLSHSQEYVRVDYKVSPNTHLIEKQLSKTKDKFVNDSISKEGEVKLKIFDSFKKSFQLINQMEMHLQATRKESYYWGENRLTSDYDPIAYKTAETMIGSNSKYYTNLEENVVLKWKNIFGESFVIKTSLNENKWKLTKESKLIGNYYCLKATISYVVSNSQGDFTKQVVAWYCPEIPYNFGPKNYSGLPGLILELTDDKIIYTVKNIDFKSGEVEINQLPKGKYITQEELNKMAKKLIEERNQMLQQD